MKKHYPIILISLFAIGIRIWWWIYTKQTAEDAFITFQFSRRLFEGYGFVINPGHPIYGSTAPLLTFLLAGWLFFSKNIILGSKIVALLAHAGGLWFLYFSMENKREAIIAAIILSVSMKLISEEMGGMEMALLFLFSMGAWYGYANGKYLLSGIMCGFLLFTRIDSAVFVFALFLFSFLEKEGGEFLLGTLIYLPWVIFSALYFGSPIPFTIIAKSVAYGINSPSAWVHFTRLVDYLSIPFFALAILSIWFIPRRNQFLSLFFIAEIILLVFSGSTFFSRYFYMIEFTTIIMISIMIGRIEGEFWKTAFLLILFYFSFGSIPPKGSDSPSVYKTMGIWLNENTHADSSIQLEHLGEVGWYADRVVLDEVGLVTPQVVQLKREGIQGYELYSYLQADYVIYQCGQGQSVIEDFRKYYFHPIIFGDPAHTHGCYEIWERYD